MLKGHDFGLSMSCWVFEEEVYVEQLAGYEEGGPRMACHLHRALCGLRQAPRAWHILLMEVLTAMGFRPSAADPSLLITDGKSGKVFILVYVDDMRIAAHSVADIDKVKAGLNEKFEAHDLGEARLFLGMAADRDRSRRQIKHSSGSLHSSWTHTTWQTARAGPSLSAWQLSSPRLRESHWTRLHTATPIRWEVCFTCQSAPGLTLHKPWEYPPSTWQLQQQCTGRQQKGSCGMWLLRRNWA